MKKATALLLALCLCCLASLAQGAEQNFRLRLDKKGYQAEEFIVGNNNKTANFPLTVDRFLGNDPMVVDLTYAITHGDSQVWTVTLNPQSVPLGGSGDKQVVDIAVTAARQAPEGAEVNIQVTGKNSQTNEIHNAYVHVVKQSHGVSIAPTTFLNTTIEPTSKLVYGSKVSFNLLVSLTGADMDFIKLIPNPVAGFTFQTLNTFGNPLQSFALAPSGLIPKTKGVKLEVTTPAGWPKGQQATVSLTAQSTISTAQATIDLKVTKAEALWTPSDLLGPKGRRHLVPPGKSTSFLLTIANTLNVTKTFSLSKTNVAPSPGWNLQFSQNQVSLAPNGQAEVKVTLTSPAGVAVGTTSDWDITLTDSQGFSNQVRVGAEATNQKKIIYVHIDALNPEYLYLNAKGTGPGSSGDWLMPNLQAFMTQSTNYKNAYDSLPSYTDPQTVCALTGFTTGKNGVTTVIGLYCGRDANNIPVIKPVDSSILRYGPEGKPVPTMFDVAKQANPKAYTAFAGNKNWVTNYFIKEQGGVDLVLTGQNMPPYISPPKAYVLGDPPTDSNPLDPGGKIGLPLGLAPGLCASDRWIMDGAIRLFDNEDPDVMYIHLGDMDGIQHNCGTSWNPAEWDDRGTPWMGDDINLINPDAVRDDPLDVAREADSLFGALWSYLDQRGSLADTYIVVLSDHGQVTGNPDGIDLRTILAENGFSNMEDYDLFTSDMTAGFFLLRPELAGAIEEALEYAPPPPGLTKNPWVVLNREEMKTGIDQFTGKTVGKPMELYSEFYVEHEVPSTDQVKWPNIVVFFDSPYHSVESFASAGEYAKVLTEIHLGIHGGFATQPIALLAYGPRFPKNQVINDTVSILDITPTLYHLQGWPVPQDVDGTPLPGLLPESP